MGKESRVKGFRKYRKIICKSTNLPFEDVSYKCKHGFIVVQKDKEVIITPNNEILEKQKKYDKYFLSKRQNQLIVRMIVVIILLVSIGIFAYFVYKK